MPPLDVPAGSVHLLAP